MKPFVRLFFFAVFSGALAAAPATENPLTLYGRAASLQRGGNLAEAQALMERSFQLARAAGQTALAKAAGLEAAILLNNTHRMPEAGRLAREVLALDQPTPERLSVADAATRAQLLGLLERSLQLQGQVGAGWQACRAAATSLRQRYATAETGGAAFALGELDGLPPLLRGYGWRLLQREAEYLAIAGRSDESLDLLAAVAAKARIALPKLPANEQFYLFKLRAAYAEHLDFMGWRTEAIAEQERILTDSRTAPDSPLTLNLRLNLLRNRSQWQGPSEAILAEARRLGEQLNARSRNYLVDRLLAKMELDLKESAAALATLARNIAEAERAGVWFDAAYARRDSLVARTDAGEDQLDGEFTAVLAEMRAHGNKGGEPTIYLEYGEYLSGHGRHGEAITMVREALRLVRAFGRTNHEPTVQSRLIATQLAAGDLAGALEELCGLEKFLAAHPELPLYRRTAPAMARVQYLLAADRAGEARQVYAGAREAARSLPAGQLQWFAPEIEAALFASHPPPATQAAQAAAPPVRLQPVEIETVAVPGKVAETRVFAVNAHRSGVRGQLVATGPGAEVKDGRLLVHAGRTPRVAALPVAVEAGGATAVDLSALPDPAQPSCEVQLTWQDANGTPGTAAKWLARWDPATAGNIVLDASTLEANPFYATCFTHQLAVPADGAPAVAFRLRSPEPLRVEYYDASNGQFLAVDANGNGDFSEEGDLHVVDASGVAAAWIPTPPRGNRMRVELRLFSPAGAPLGLPPTALLISAEVHQNGAWILAAEDVLR